MANASILAAFERMWQHVVAALSGKANVSHTHDSAYDALGSANTAFTSAKSYTDTAISNLINGAPTTLDTLGEIATAMAENEDVVAALDEAIGTKANAADLTSHTNNKSNPHGVTLAQLGVTATTTELNKMDGVTATTAEINKLKGLTATTAELNYVDGVTSNIQTQLNSKATTGHGIYYGTCETAAATAAKVVTLTDSTGFSLTTGAVIVVKFTYANSAANPTMNVNSTGAKSIKRYGTTAVSTGTTTTGWIAGAVQVFIYDGTNWVRDYWNNTTYSNASMGTGYATCATAAATVAKAASLSSYALSTGGVVAVKFTYAVPASATLNINSRGAKAIRYRGAAITADIIKAGDVATFVYDGSYYQLIAIDRWQEDITDIYAKLDTKADASHIQFITWEVDD